MADDTKAPVKVHPRNDREPSLSSKKFLAFVISILGWNILIGIGIFKYMPLNEWSTVLLLCMVAVQGVVEVGYIVGQAGLDAMEGLFATITSFGHRPPKDPPAEDEKKQG